MLSPDFQLICKGYKLRKPSPLRYLTGLKEIEIVEKSKKYAEDGDEQEVVGEFDDEWKFERDLDRELAKAVEERSIRETKMRG